MVGNKSKALPRKVLVIRFSAIGDVAMTIPVLYALAAQYPETEFTLLSRKGLAKIFLNPPANFTFRGCEMDQYPGFAGLVRLFGELRKEGYDGVCDLHDVLRTRVLRTLFRGLTTAKVSVIDKGRSQKRELTRNKGLKKEPLPSNFTRYAEAFHRLGYTFEMNFRTMLDPSTPLSKEVSCLLEEEGLIPIGIAPFANHPQKVYPVDRMEEVVRRLSETRRFRIFLFGGGAREKEILSGWEERYAQVTSMVGRLNFAQEIELMSRLKTMVSMDSSNMHLASLVGCPVVSIWGATHWYAGFLGYGQSREHLVEQALTCRPCSIYGNKPCFRGDFACMQGIAPEQIVGKINQVCNIQLSE
jgi:ADP-heptose:LPS heptosyltransferase